MADKISKSRRSQNMAAIRSKDTSPEWLVRRLIHARGFRYRLHARELPGKPDIVFRKRRKVIFVHGCFWHGCAKPACKDARMPKSNRVYWETKLAGNRRRDEQHVAKLRSDGWGVLVVWDCETRDKDKLDLRLTRFIAG